MEHIYTEHIIFAGLGATSLIPDEAREEIIRCRDCKFFGEKGIYRDWWCNRLGLKPSKDSFCSWAQKGGLNEETTA